MQKKRSNRESEAVSKEDISRVMQEFGRRGGKKSKMSSEQARKNANARWNKKESDPC